MIDRQQVEYIADLARLSLSPEEKEAMAAQLSEVLDYMEQLNSVDTSGVEPTCFVVPEHDPLRDDTVRESLRVDETLANGPSVKSGHFAVPKVIR